jgi:hypothetical protein
MYVLILRVHDAKKDVSPEKETMPSIDISGDGTTIGPEII